MRKFFWIGVLLFGAFTQGFSQNYYVAVADGPWSDPSTWANPTIGTPGSGAGTGIPGAGSFAYTDGYEILVDQDVTVANLAIRSTNRAGVSAQLNFGGSFFPFTITVTNIMAGVASIASLPIVIPSGLPALQAPTVSVIEDNANLIIRLTGTVTTGALQAWSLVAPINTVHINPASGVVRTASNTGGVLAITEELKIISGTFRPQRILADATGSAVITVDAGTILDLATSVSSNVTGSTGVLGTKFNDIQINGTVNVGAVNSLSTENISMGATGTLNVAFNGATQTEGWWYQTARPTGGTLDPASTVNFTAGAAQKVYSRTYGILRLSGTGDKDFVGNETMVIQGNFIIESSAVSVSSTKPITFQGGVNNNGTFTSSQPVHFTGTALEQKIEGSSTFTLTSGLTINKSAGQVLLDKNISVSGGLAISAGTLDLGDKTLTLVTGNISKSGGTLTADAGSSGGTIVITGTTSVTGVSTTTFNNVTINVGGTLTAHGTSMSITGDLVNNGTFNRSTGTLVFAGSTQSISGSSLTRVNNLTVNGTSTLSNESAGGMRLDGILNVLVGGTFDADGTSNRIFTVSSSSLTAGGKIAKLPSPATSLTGLLRVERFIDGPDTWRYLSSPVVGANLSMWRDDFPVTGSFGDASPNGVNGVIASTAPSVYQFRSSNSSTTASYVALSGTNTSDVLLVSGLGYSAYTYLPGDFTITVTGIHRNVASFSQSGLATGNHLLGNPYPCPIDYDLLTRSNVTSSVAIRTANNVYTIWNGSGISGGGDPPFAGWAGELATGQAFWVESIAPGASVTFSENAKITTTNQYVRKAAPSDYVKISLKQGIQKDAAIVLFREDATDEFDVEYDATKLENGDPSPLGGNNSYLNLALVNPGSNRKLTFNALPPIPASGTKSMYLSVADVKTGESSLTFSGLENFNVGYSIVLYDTWLNKSERVTEGFQYEFQVTTDRASYGDSRFRIDFSNMVTAVEEPELNGVSVYPNSTEGLIKISIPENVRKTITDISLFDTRGVELMRVNNQSMISSGEVTMDITDRPASMYIVRLVAPNKVHNIKVIKR